LARKEKAGGSDPGYPDGIERGNLLKSYSIARPGKGSEGAVRGGTGELPSASSGLINEGGGGGGERLRKAKDKNSPHGDIPVKKLSQRPNDTRRNGGIGGQGTTLKAL